MGIQQFFPAISILFPEAQKRVNMRDKSIIQYNHVLIDVNHMLYLSFKKDLKDHVIINIVIAYISRVLKKFPPIKSVYIAIDGPGPKAKFITQCLRRANAPLSQLRFTPGTEFMQKLKDNLCLYAISELNKPQFSETKFYVSGSDREGEGEYKIYEHIKYLNKLQELTIDEQSKESCLVVGNDSDLIVFGLNSHDSVKVDVFCRNAKEQTIIWQLNKIKNSILSNVLGCARSNILDFTFISLLNGNDYAPRLSGFDYVRVYSHWKYLKSQTQNQDRNIVCFHGNSWKLDLVFLDEVLKAANVIVVNVNKIKVKFNNDVERFMSLSATDWKSNLNNLQQIFCKNGAKIDYLTSGVQGRFQSKICISGVAGENDIVLGVGIGPTKKSAERQASIQALNPDSYFMKAFVKNGLKEGYDTICEYIKIQCTQENEKMHSSDKGELVDQNNQVHNFSAEIPDCEKRKLEKKQEAEKIGIKFCLYYLQAVIWITSLMTVQCINYDYFYPFYGKPTVKNMQDYIKQCAMNGIYKLEFHIQSKTNSCEKLPKVYTSCEPLVASSASKTALKPLDFFSGLVELDEKTATLVPEALFNSIVSYESKRTVNYSISNDLKIHCKLNSPTLLEYLKSRARKDRYLSQSINKLPQGYFAFQPTLLFQTKIKNLMLSSNAEDEDHKNWEINSLPLLYRIGLNYKKNMPKIEGSGLICKEEDPEGAIGKPRLFKKMHVYLMQKRRYINFIRFYT